MDEQQMRKPRAVQVDRKKLLNIVYFVDASRTKSFTLSLGWAIAIAVISGLIVIWAVVASSFVLYLVKENLTYRSDYRAALAAIYDYQSRNDRIYELAYPDGRQQGSGESDMYDAVTATEQEDVNLSAAAGAHGTEKPESTPVTDTPAHTQATTADLDVKAATPPPQDSQPTPNEWMIDVEKPVVEAKSGQIELKFAMRNRQKNSKANGTFWAIATVMKESGQPAYFSFPQNLKLESKGNATDGRMGTRFSIRNYAERKFSFQIPTDLAGMLVNIDIGLMTPDGASKTFKVPVQIPLTPVK